ncbi:MAG: hypothetical protein LLG16_01460 [Euryarchaeota archaeon]|nr:hypothetical protein [Euryarchaeota archaeon]
MANEDDDKKPRKPDGPVCDRALLCADEWDEPKCRKVLGEYHKEGLPEGLPGVDADLERFEEFWSAKGSVNKQGSYHKEGAPFLDDVDGKAHVSIPTEGESESKEPGPSRAVKQDARPAAPKQPMEMPSPQSGRTLDLATAEIISYALVRVLFGTGVRIPIKKDGIIDADVTIRGKDIIINTNEVYTNVPDLAVWKVIYTHKGTPIFELGRSVPKGLKIRRWNALRFGFQIWKQARARTNIHENLKKEREKALLGEGKPKGNEGQ